MRNRLRDERGNAVLEFHTVGLLLLLPLVYVLLTVLDVQRAAFGTTQAAREAGRVFAQVGNEQSARYAAGIALADQGLGDAASSVQLACSAQPCLTPGAEVRVVVRTDVTLPFLPRVLAGAVNAEIPVAAEHLVVVDRFRASPP